MQLYKKIVLGILLLTLVGYLVGAWMTDKAIKSYETELTNQIDTQKNYLLELAEITARNGQNKQTETLVRDCGASDREAFDVLLGRLNENLSNAQLAELDRLFGRCGTYYADRKTAAALQLQQEVRFYDTQVSLMESLLTRDLSEKYNLEKWDELVLLEVEQANRFRELVQLQDQIITSLLAGSIPSSSEIVSILEQVSEAQENLVLANTQAASVRESLIQL